MRIYEIDNKIGIEQYSTKIKGIGGTLKKRVSDFKVQEIDGNGNILIFFNKNRDYSFLIDRKLKYLSFNLEKIGLSTVGAIKKISKLTNIDQNYFYYRGLKDKRGITVQKVSVSGNPIEKFLQINERGIKLYNFNAGKRIFLGEHLGNYFNIIVRDVKSSNSDLEKKIESIWNIINEKGLINYFGYQRFGTIRPITHLVGKEILKNDYEMAIKIYITMQSKHEKPAILELRKIIEKDWPNVDKDIVEKLPHNLFFERNCLNLIENSNLDYKNIMYSVFKEKLLTLFIHAYQSYLFNKILSEKIKKTQGNIIIGDIVIMLDYLGLPSNKIIDVKKDNFDLINKLIENKKAVLGVPLIGKKILNKTEIIEQYNILNLIKQENIKLDDLNFQIGSDIEIKGEFRASIIYPELFSYKILKEKKDKQKTIIKFSFSLQKGSYATIFLREFMKTNPLNY